MQKLFTLMGFIAAGHRQGRIRYSGEMGALLSCTVHHIPFLSWQLETENLLLIDIETSVPECLLCLNLWTLSESVNLLQC